MKSPQICRLVMCLEFFAVGLSGHWWPARHLFCSPEFELCSASDGFDQPKLSWMRLRHYWPVL
jgi:hypothetical protein